VVAKRIVPPAPSGPTGIAALPGLALWFDGSDSSSVGLAEDSRVSSWADSSGNAYDAVVFDPTNAPLWVAEGLNGLGLVRFLPISARLTIDSRISSADSFTVFLVWSSVGPGGVGQGGFYLSPSLLVNSGWIGSNNWGAFRSSTFSDSGQSIIGAHRVCCLSQVDLATWSLYTDSVESVVSVTEGESPYLNLTASILGTDQYDQNFNGDLCELVYCSPALSVDLIGSTMAILATKWGLSS
jgi:hypothetical protein